MYITDLTPHKAAKDLDDKVLKTQIILTARYLSGAFINSLGEEAVTKDVDKPDKVLVYENPIRQGFLADWLTSNKGNISWMIEYFNSMAIEHADRFAAPHKSAQLLPGFRRHLKYVNGRTMTVMPVLVDDIAPWVKNPIEIHRVAYYKNVKTRQKAGETVTWTHDKEPAWFQSPIIPQE